MKAKINGHQVEPKWNYLVIRKFGTMRGFDSPQQVMDFLSEIVTNSAKGNELAITFDTMDAIAEMILCAVEEGARQARQEIDITVEDCAIWMNENPDQFQEFFKIILEGNQSPPPQKRGIPKKTTNNRKSSRSTASKK